MVIDATSTNAGASGKSFWGVNADTADYLVFGRRSYVEGFYCRPQAKYAAITFGGDYLRMLQFKVLKETIEKERLIEKVGKVSGYFRQQLESAASKSSQISSVGGAGLNIYVNTTDGSAAKALQAHLLNQGIISRLNGTHGVIFKPALVLEEKHADLAVRAVASFK